MSASREQGIRPGLWLFAAAFLGLLGAGIYAFTVGEPASTEGAAAPTDAEGGRAQGRDRGERARYGRPDVARAGSGEYVHHDWGTESEGARDLALGLPASNFWRDRATYGEPAQDPQLAAMWRSFQGSRPPEADSPELPFEPTARRADLVDSDGDVAANPSSCDVRVLPVAAYQFNCVVRVMCDGQVLYPNPNQSAGYVPCEVDADGRVVRAVDDGSTGSDGDPLVNLDLAAGTVTVEDFEADGSRRYRATLRIRS